MATLVERLRRRLPRPAPVRTADPFRTLELQARLSRLAGELTGLDAGGERRFAAGHHARAALLAYEHTLREACRLAGLPVEPGRGPEFRLLAEAMLSQAGWEW